MAACLVRDLAGCIMHHSLQKIDMAEVLEYSLTSVALSLSHVDGTMQKTHKATLMKPLESEGKATPLPSINTTMSYILSLINGCPHQLKIAREICHQLPSISLFHLRNAREIGIKP